MSNEIIKQDDTELITREKVIDYINAFLPSSNLNENEKNQFIEIAKAYQLNPFKREIYCIAYGYGDKRKLSILTGYETYLKRAERLKVLDGWNVTTEGNLKDRSLKAIIHIKRKDWTQPFSHEVYFTEYVQNTTIWQSKPITMIKKVAIAQGFRLAFPDDLGGMPYTSDEVPEEMQTIKDVTTQNEPLKSLASDIQDKAPSENAKKIKDEVLELSKDPKVIKNLNEDQLKLFIGLHNGTISATLKDYKEHLLLLRALYDKKDPVPEIDEENAPEPEFNVSFQKEDDTLPKGVL